MKKITLVGEIGLNSNGSTDIAKQLINLAKGLNWHAVKFQKRTLEKVIPKEMWHIKKETPWGVIDYIDYKKKLEFGKKEYDIIDEYCKQVGIDWFASAWDIDSQYFLDKYDLKYNKIASPMLTYIPLLEHVAEQKKLTIISTGMSQWRDINRAIRIFKGFNCKFVLMHCVGLYPCPIDKLNLNMITVLKNRYPHYPVGYSGHSEGAIDAVIASVLGAEYIEKHITLNRAMFGSDQAASIEPGGMEFIAKHCNHLPQMLGEGIKCIWDEEEKIAKKMRYWEK
jgi:N-acetylneuraminate synthase